MRVLLTTVTQVELSDQEALDTFHTVDAALVADAIGIAAGLRLAGEVRSMPNFTYVSSTATVINE